MDGPRARGGQGRIWSGSQGQQPRPESCRAHHHAEGLCRSRWHIHRPSSSNRSGRLGSATGFPAPVSRNPPAQPSVGHRLQAAVGTAGSLPRCRDPGHSRYFGPVFPGAHPHRRPRGRENGDDGGHQCPAGAKRRSHFARHHPGFSGCPPHWLSASTPDLCPPDCTAGNALRAGGRGAGTLHRRGGGAHSPRGGGIGAGHPSTANRL